MGNEITYTDQIACVARELAMRERVYPKFVASGRMTDDKAARELACMRAVLETIQACHVRETVAASMGTNGTGF